MSRMSRSCKKLFKMQLAVTVVLTLISSTNFCCCCSEKSINNTLKWPTIVISVLVRNKAHTLPYFLTCLHQLDYPKNRLYLWIHSDYNEDQSIDIIEKWAEKYALQYTGVYISTNKSSGHLHNDENGPTHWSPMHFRHVISLRDEALEFGRKIWADYLFMLDADAFLTHISTLKTLVSKRLPIVAPVLLSDGFYSNFWCGMTENYYYKRTEDYTPILNREKVGCFDVPMVHTAVLISLREIISDKLTYNPNKINSYDGPEDDIIAFAINAKNNGLQLTICNDNIYGFIPVPLEDSSDLKDDYEQLLNVKLRAISRTTPLPLDSFLEEYVTYPTMWKFGCDEIYMINLERRVERRKLMESNFKELGMDVQIVEAFDGRKLDMNDLKMYSITIMPDYEDPYHKRPMKAGEIGCFLSHYNIWKEIIEKGHKTTLVLEDDVHFQPYFRHRFLQLMEEIGQLDWDLVYIGRKILLDGDEEYATAHTTKPLYSYWTLGYLLSLRGANKLIQADPLSKMLPVDEFLPIMFDQHPNATWKAHFTNRNLLAYSAAPLLINPTYYTGQDGYISDTEDSTVIQQENYRNIKNEL